MITIPPMGTYVMYIDNDTRTYWVGKVTSLGYVDCVVNWAGRRVPEGRHTYNAEHFADGVSAYEEHVYATWGEVDEQICRRIALLALLGGRTP